jgi:hypothetical protein
MNGRHLGRGVRISLGLLALSLFALALGGPGCAAGGEGDRCTYFMSANPSINGTDECQDGLACYPGTSSGFNTNTTGTYDRCCPSELSQATVPACMQGGMLDGGCPTCGRDSSTDTATDTKKRDTGGSETSKDTASENSPDAPMSDAPAEAHDASEGG